MEEKTQQLTPISPMRVSLKLNFHTVLMQRKHGLLFEVINLKTINHESMVFFGQAEDVAERKQTVAASSEFFFFVKIACEFLSHLTRLSLRQSLNDFQIMPEHRDKH